MEEHRVFHRPVHLAAAGNHGVGDLRVRAGDVGRLDGCAGVDGPALVVHVQAAAAAGQQVHVGVPQGVDGTHVLPVARETVGHQLLARVQHVGDDVLAEVVGGVGVGLVVDQVFAQLGPGEHIDAHGGQIALGLGGLLLELVNLVVGLHVQNAEALGLLHGDLQHRDSAGCPGLLMEGDHLGVVHLVDMVAGQDHDIFGIIHVQEADVLIDGVGRTLVPAALFALAQVGGEDMDAAVGPVQVPGLAVA